MHQYNIHKYTMIYPDVKTHSQIDNIPTDKRWHEIYIGLYINMEVQGLIRTVEASWKKYIYKYKKGYQPKTNMVRNENGDMLANSTMFWLDGRITSVKYCMYMGLIMLCKLKYIYLKHFYLSLLLLRF